MNRKQYAVLFDVHMQSDPVTGRQRRVVEYIGSYYRLTRDASAGKRRVLLFCWLICVGLYIACGLANSSGSRCFYVLPFYLLMLFPLFYWGLGVIRLLRQNERFTAVDKDEGIDRVRNAAMGFLVLGALHTVGETVLMSLGGAFSLPLEIVCTFCVAAGSMLAWLSVRMLGALGLEEETPAAKAAKLETDVETLD